MSASRPGRTPYWPDRSALRRRRNARRAFWLLVGLVLVLPWFGYQHVRDWLRPGTDEDANPAAVDGAVEDRPARRNVPEGSAAGAPMVAEPAHDAGNPDRDAAAGLDAIDRDARAGDGAAAAARLADLGAEVHRQVLLADRGNAIRREAARRDVADIPGVRAAGWVDRMTMLLVMSSRGAGHATIAEACRRIAAHGDVAGLAVRVQEVAGDQVSAGALLGECRPAAGASPAGGTMQAFPGTPLRAAQGGAEADGGDPEAAQARRRRAEESLRILSETTPELPTAPQPRVDP